LAINKNFVVKNGLEVSTDLILADASTNRVGIGSTIPTERLDVNGTIAAKNAIVSGFSTVSQVFNVGSGGTIFAARSDSGYVGVGTGVPSYLLDIRSPVSTGQTALYVYGDARITGDINIDDIILDQADVNRLYVTQNIDINGGGRLYVSGITTLASYVDINDSVDINEDLNVVGLTTLGGYVDINDSVDISIDLNVVGLTTLGGYVDINDSVDINEDLNVVGLATLGGYVDINDSVDISTDLNVSGIGTIGIVEISSGIITATSGIITYYGDGSNLQNILSGVGIATEGGLVGTGATILDLRGPGVSTVTVSSGIATINISGGGGGASVSISSVAPSLPASGDLWYSTEYGRTFVWYDEVILGIGSTAVWVDASPFNQTGSFLSIYGGNMLAGLGVTSGSLSAPSVYFNNSTNSGFYSPSSGQFGIVSVGTEIVNVNASGINVSGVVTATDFNASGIITSSGAIVSGIITASGASFSGNVSIGDVSIGATITPSGDGSFVGVITCFDLNTTSDISLKQNVETVDNALSVVNELRGVKFEWKKDGRPSYGVIAQELEQILPELVTDTDPKTVNYNGIIGVLIEAVKELSAEIQELKKDK
jgi:hypothetical protein